ncbi:terminase [Xenorhabdus budapestensis]|uniref:Terminase n=1 Tax=Xenorhabdus budapestensis TaxID=290110 RepID=A0A2D0J363_XENBU|nr:terminase [Xenorhabdus budapestensis]
MNLSCAEFVLDSAALHDTIQKARGIPSQWTEMLTKRFNIWCQGEIPWMGEGTWKSCQLDYDENDLKGLECYAGLDLSLTGDITSICYTFPVDNKNKLLLLTRHYLPEAQLQNPANKNRAVYRQWAQIGWIRTTQGDCIDYDVSVMTFSKTASTLISSWWASRHGMLPT